MVARQHYRWDFIGLSTDSKPTPETSEKVVDGSTFYCSDNSKLYVWYKTQWYEKTVSGGGGGTSDFDQLSNRPKYNGVTMNSETDIPEVIAYTAGDNVTISDGEISATDTTYTAGANITINDGEISATDTTYSNFTGTDGTAAGAAGLVPAPATTDAGKFLKADGTWDTAGGGGGPTVVQTTGTSTTDVMSQNAVTSMVFADPATQYKIKIGAGTSTSEGTDGVEIGHNAAALGAGAIALGQNSSAQAPSAIALGRSTSAQGAGSVAIGNGSKATAQGEVNFGTSVTTTGYNYSNYRLLTGVYDGQSAHDAATVGQITPTTDSSAPTTATVGRVGQFYIDTSTGSVYMCIAADSVTPAYTWKLIAS